MYALAHLFTTPLFVMLFFAEQRLFLEQGKYLPTEHMPLAILLAFVVALPTGIPLHLLLYRFGWRGGAICGACIGFVLAHLGFIVTDGFVGSVVPFVETPLLDIRDAQLGWVALLVGGPGIICGAIFGFTITIPNVRGASHSAAERAARTD